MEPKSEQKAQNEQGAMERTQGRKGCRAKRINMAFTPENHEFIRLMAKATGRSLTAYVNEIITAYRNEHPEFMEKARGFLDFINEPVKEGAVSE